MGYARVTGQWRDSSNRPLPVKITFTPKPDSIQGEYSIIAGVAPVVVFTDAAGEIDIPLLRTDSSELNIVDWTYSVTEKLAGTPYQGKLIRKYSMYLEQAELDLANAGQYPDSEGDLITEGDPGPPGRGIADITLEGSTIVFTMTDATEEEILLPTGSPGGSTYTQASPAATWIVAHNLGYNPAGFVVKDNAGNINFPSDVDWPDSMTMRLYFSAAFSGTVRVS